MRKWIYSLLLLSSCRHPDQPDLEKAKSEILELHHKQRSYHFNRNAKLFTDLHSDEFFVINSGDIGQPSRRNSFETFDQYFKSVEFVKWDDKRPPIIRFSNDASVAYVAVEKLVILKMPSRSGHVTDTSHFAWMTVYKKTPEGWRIDGVASTNKQSMLSSERGS